MTAGPWRAALVTGASSGIGRAMARLLAIGGLERLVVVARDRDRLVDLAEELRDRHATEVEVLPADLTDPTSRALVEARLSDPAAPAMDLLVNNAGFGTHGPLADLPLADEDREVQLNATAVLRLTRVALPGMIERGRGSVTNVASLAALQPMPGNATYAATKAFAASLGPAVHEELRGTGVTVTTVLPGFTRTEFQQRAGTEQDVARVPRLLWMSPEAVAGSALAAAARGQPWCVPGWGYRVAAAVVDALPRGLLWRIVGRSAGVSRNRPPRTSSAW